MVRPLGENMQQEWDAEPFRGELWDALEARKQGREAGVETLTDLAAGGSALAMMYLGLAYVKESASSDIMLREEWLIKAARAGSIEGRLQLAAHYHQQKRWVEAESELKALAEREYSPAMYALGDLLYRGELGRRSVPEAVHYLKLAKDFGNLPARARLSWIYRKENFGIRGRLVSHWHCLAKIPAIIWYSWNYPHSDRLRRG